METKLYRFGVFELNTATHQLLKQGRRVRLQQQPRQVLEILLEEPGGLVTRQELQRRLWPSGVHVDFELGLTGAIKRLRLALDDSADNPRFVETVPKCGYRFIAPFEAVPMPSPPTERAATAPAVQPAGLQPGTASPATTPATEPTAPAAAVTGPAPAPRSRRGARAASLLIAPAIAVLAVLAVGLRPTARPAWVTRVVKLTRSGGAWPQESLLTDGARLYYTEYVVGTGFRLRQILLNGDEDTVATGLPSHILFRALSPDHTTFLAISQDDAERGNASPLWAIPVVGGSPRRLGSVHSNDFAWSPEGDSLAYAGENRLFVSDPEGGGAHVLATVAGHVICPRWSPDGRRIRFTVLGTSAGLAIWEVAADGTRPHPLAFDWPGTPMEGFGEWTSDGRYYVFVSRREGISNLWALEESTDWLHRRRAEPIQLTAGPLSYSRPLPSPDGRRVFALGTEPAAELVRYDGTRREFVPFLGGRPAEHLDFSRDGRWVSYVSYPDGALWRARGDGSDAMQLTAPPLRVFLPRWSPDGTRILFSGRVAGAPSRIFTVAPDGGNPEPLVAEPHAQADPSWSATGDSIVYGRDRDSGERELALFRVEPKRGRSERIPGTDGLHGPLWSPDGRHLLARAEASGLLFLFDSRRSRWTALTRRRADYAAWSADSQFVHFHSAVGARTALFRVHVPDGAEEKVVELPFKPAGSYGAWSGLAPDGSPLVLRDRGRTDVYALSVTLADGR